MISKLPGGVPANVTGLISLTSAASSPLTIQTLDTNQNVVVAPNGTGGLQVPAGATATPGIRFTGALTTGLWADGNGMRLTVGATDIVVFASGGAKTSNWYTALKPNTDIDSAVTLGVAGNRFYNARFGGGSALGVFIGNGANPAQLYANTDAANANLFVKPDGTGITVFNSAIQIGTGANCVTIGSGGNYFDIFTQNGTQIMRWLSSGVLFTQPPIPYSDIGGANYRLGTGTNRWQQFFVGPTGTSISGASPSATAGLASEAAKITKAVTAIANAVATAVLTVTIPNASHSGVLRVRLAASLGAGGAIGANEASAGIAYDIAFARTPGVNAVAAIAAAVGSTGSAAVAGADTITVTAAVSAVSGAVGASNSFTINVTITRGGGGSSNHTCQVIAELLNANASGITLS